MITKIASYIPAVSEPDRALSFNEKLMWLGIVSVVFLMMGEITLYGVSKASLSIFREFEMILGSKMGSLATLGIGPIVTASIVLQLLMGSKILEWDIQDPVDREKFTAAQKILTIVLAFIEAIAYVMGGGIMPDSHDMLTIGILVTEIAFGGIAIMYLDEIINKYGIGSGISLFIALGVSKVIFVRLFNPFLTAAGAPAGLLFQMLADIGAADMVSFVTHLIPLISTVIVFAIVMYAQSIKVEVPLAFGSVSGFGRRWPLNFIYTSNMPIILLAALLANLRLTAQLMYSRGITWMGTFSDNGAVTGGLLYYLTPPRTEHVQILMISLGLALVLGLLYGVFFLKKKLKLFVAASGAVGLAVGVGALIYLNLWPIPAIDLIRMTTYLVFFAIGSVLFSVLWVITSGMDAESVAEQIEGIGMQIPGFRRDRRIIERVLSKYINVLTMLGGLFVGMLAAFADFTGALGSGTGILLTTMIIYNFYEIMLYQYINQMNPAMKRFFKK